MRPAEEVRAELVRGWIARAEEDYRVAIFLADEKAPYPGAVAFHAQQAAEKHLKAALVHFQLEFPKTHDLGQLLDLLAGQILSWPSDCGERRN